MSIPSLDERKCPTQGKTCPAIPACQQDAKLYMADASARLGRRIVFDYDKCNGCETCITACCGDAIVLKE